MLHSPAKRLVTKDVTDQKELSTGLEGMAISDQSKAPKHVQFGKRKTVEVMEQTFLCDLFAGYSAESGNARFDQTFMRDIIYFYRHGHVKHASAASARGKAIPIGPNAASAKVSDLDVARLAELEKIKAAMKAQKQAEEASAAAAAAAAAAAEDDDEEEGEGAQRKKRRNAGVKRKRREEDDSDAQEADADAHDTDRRGQLTRMTKSLKNTDDCGVQYVQREAALGTASLYGDTEEVAKANGAKDAEGFGVIGLHMVAAPHTFKGIHDAGGKLFVDNKNTAVMSRVWTISNVQQHYNYNAATMLAPTNEKFNIEDFSFSNYYHFFYQKSDFIDLEAEATEGIKSWRFTQGGTDARATARGGAGGGLGYSFRSQPHVCFCEGDPCLHRVFTGSPTEHRVCASKQEPADRAQATNFIDSIDVGSALASPGDLADSTASNEPIWLSIAKGKKQTADAPFRAAGGAGPSGTLTIRTNWAYVDVQWLNKVKTDSAGNVHYEAWAQPGGERTVLTKPKILTVAIEWLRVEERRNMPTRYVLSAAVYQRLLDAVK